MKRFNSWIRSFLVPTLEPFQAFNKLVGDRIEEREGQFICHGWTASEAAAAKPIGHPIEKWASFLECFSQLREGSREIATILEAWTFGGVAADGLKVYCPTLKECLALSHVELNIPFSLYQQPFPTFIVVLPDELYKSPISEDVGYPAAFLSRYDSTRRIFSGLTLGTGRRQSLLSLLCWQPDDTRTIEETLQEIPDDDYPDCNTDEMAVTDRTRRIGMNANLLLTHSGYTRRGWANPEFASRLTASLKKKNLPQSARLANERELHLQPEVYGFDQVIRLYDEEPAPASIGGDANYEVRPHWRRGHWANQACGPRHSERKLTFRKAVLVNSHLLAGPLFNTRVTVTT